MTKRDILRKRDSSKHKTGLVLGSGAARGFSQIGVIKALVEHGVNIDMIAGTSVGAVVGACYAKLLTKKGFNKTLSKADWNKVFHVADMDLDSMFNGFADEKKITEWLKHVIGDVSFEDLSIPLAIVAADAHTGEEVVIKNGSVLKAIKASISIPVLFTPVKFGERLLVDGAFANPVPVDVAKDMGATFLIACDTTRSGADKRIKEVKQKIMKSLDTQNRRFMQNALGVKRTLRKLVNNATANSYEKRRSIDRNVLRMFRTLKQTLHSIESEVVKAQLRKADIVITPDVSHIDMLAFSRGKEAVIKGYEATIRVLAAHS